jgi:hypothetical protein
MITFELMKGYIEYMEIKPILELEGFTRDIAIRLYTDGWYGGTMESLVTTAKLLTLDEVIL